MERYFIKILFIFLTIAGCKKGSEANTATDGSTYPAERPASLGITGDTADVTTPARGGLVLMGGGTDVDAAFRWMIERSGGGDVVIIRASGTAAYNSYVYALGKVNSVETLKIDSRNLADNETVAAAIRNAEMLFIAGGDQSDYMRYWKGTKTMDAINYLLNDKKVPVGGTSAGCAILGRLYYSGEAGSVVSAEALADPYHTRVTLYADDFLRAPYMENVITDQHYVARSRQGRHLAFMARFIKEGRTEVKGIAADERTAVCVDADGKATVFGSGKAYFLRADKTNTPENCVSGEPLTWNNGQKAVWVYEIGGPQTGNGSFDAVAFDTAKAEGGNRQWWWAVNGILNIQK